MTENRLIKDTTRKIKRMEMMVDKILERKNELKEWVLRSEIEDLDLSIKCLIKKTKELYSSTKK